MTAQVTRSFSSQPPCYRRNAGARVASCGDWPKSAADQRQIGKTLPDIPKKSTGRGDGKVCPRRTPGMVMFRQVLTKTSRHNASRQGARAVSDGAEAMNKSLTAGPVSGATITVAPSPLSGAEFGEAVTVSVSFGFHQVSWLTSPMYVGG